MRRWELLGALGGALASRPLAAAQQSTMPMSAGFEVVRTDGTKTANWRSETSVRRRVLDSATVTIQRVRRWDARGQGNSGATQLHLEQYAIGPRCSRIRAPCIDLN